MSLPETMKSPKKIKMKNFILTTIGKVSTIEVIYLDRLDF